MRETLGIGPEPVILYLGRISSASKADLFPLILAFGDTPAATRLNATLVIAGDDTQFEMADSLREFASTAVPQAKVTVFPNPTLDNKTDLYRMADIFVSPSDSLQETFGITLLEAMASGLPVIVSDWDGYKDIVVEGVTGFTIRTLLPEYPHGFGDAQGGGGMLAPDLLAATTIVDVPELAHAMTLLLENAGLRREMGRAGRKRVEQLYDWPVVVSEYEALWAELAEQALCSPAADVEQFSAPRLGHQEIFGHYATHTFRLSDRIRLTVMGKCWDRSYGLLLRSSGMDLWLQESVLESIVDVARQQGEVDAGVLLRTLEAGGVPSWLGLAHLCRLMKYGLLETVEQN